MSMIYLSKTFPLSEKMMCKYKKKNKTMGFSVKKNLSKVHKNIT